MFVRLRLFLVFTSVFCNITLFYVFMSLHILFCMMLFYSSNSCSNFAYCVFSCYYEHISLGDNSFNYFFSISCRPYSTWKNKITNSYTQEQKQQVLSTRFMLKDFKGNKMYIYMMSFKGILGIQYLSLQQFYDFLEPVKHVLFCKGIRLDQIVIFHIHKCSITSFLPCIQTPCLVGVATTKHNLDYFCPCLQE